MHLYCDTSTGKPRPYLTKSYRRQVFETLHNMSHPGAKTSTKLIGDRFVWPSMRKDCRVWARCCISCQRSKVSRHVKSSLGDFATPSTRFSHVHADIIGPLPPVNSYRYCLTITDRFTRWSEVCPLQTITAESVTMGLLSCWISRFGCPEKLTVDRGSQFTSHTFKDVAKQFGIELRHTMAWHPQANGMIERFHRQLKAAIMAHSNENWIEALPLVLLGIRSAFKEDIKATSAELVYGEPLRLPGEFLSKPTQNEVIDPSHFLDRLRKCISRLRPIPASRHSQPGSFVFKELLNNCSYVFLRIGPIRRSLQQPYKGPYEVTSRDEKNVSLKINNQIIKVSIDRVKPAFVLQEDFTKTSTSTSLPHSKFKTTRSGRHVRPPNRFR